MFVAAFIFLTVFLSIYFEVLAGSMGIIIPLTALSVFYFSVTRGWTAGVFIGLIAGTVLDMLYGRTLLLTPFSMVLIATFSIFWLHQGDPESVMLHFLPGAVSAFIAVFPILLVNAIHYSAFFNNFFILVFSTVAGAMLLPIMIPFYDSLAGKLGLLLYRGAKSRALERRY